MVRSKDVIVATLKSIVNDDINEDIVLVWHSLKSDNKCRPMPGTFSVITASNHQAWKALQVQGLSPDKTLSEPVLHGSVKATEAESPEDILCRQH